MTEAGDVRNSAGLRQVYFWTDPLPCPEEHGAALLGAKGASLRLLHRCGLSVPPGFTVTVDACRQYHANERRWPPGLWEEIRAGLDRLEAITGQKLGSATNPLTLAIRSGAAQSFPGLMATFLHCGLTLPLVKQIDDEPTWNAFADFLESYVTSIDSTVRRSEFAQEDDELGSAQLLCGYWLDVLSRLPARTLSSHPEEIIQNAIASVFDSSNSAAVRRFGDISHRAIEGTAVTVQAMFSAEVSGVVFSRYFEQSSRDDLVVEAIPGSGKRLVAGEVTPVRWLVDRNTFVARTSSSSHPMFASDAIRSFEHLGLRLVCQAAVQLENHLGQPVDVEFGYAAGKLAYFQVRPAAQNLTARTERAQERARQHVADLAQKGQRFWVRHGLSETLPAPTPLTWDLWRRFMTGDGGYGRLYRMLGFEPSAVVLRDGFLSLIGGRIYASPERFVEMFCAGYPLQYDLAALRRDPNVLNAPPTALDLEQLDPWFLLRWPWIAWVMFRSHSKQMRLMRRASYDFDMYLKPKIQSWLNEQLRIDLTSLTLPQLISLFEGRTCRVFDEFAPETLLPGTLGAIAWSKLQEKLQTILEGAAAVELCTELLNAVPDPTLERQRELLNLVAIGDQPIDAFLQEYGHRGPNEMEFSQPRWNEWPKTEFEADLKLLAFDSVQKKTDLRTLENRLHDVLSQAGAGFMHRELSDLLHHAVNLIPYREAGKHELLRGIALIRQVVLEISRRVHLEDDVWFLEFTELLRLDADRDVKQRVMERRCEYRENLNISVPSTVEASSDFSASQNSSMIPGQSLPATSLSPGKAAGRVVLLGKHPHRFNGVANAIVVATTIDAGSMPFLANAAALVVERGGILSHVGILARQLAIPAVMAEDITSIVRDGDSICVDADRGNIELPDRAE